MVSLSSITTGIKNLFSNKSGTSDLDYLKAGVSPYIQSVVTTPVGLASTGLAKFPSVTNTAKSIVGSVLNTVKNIAVKNPISTAVAGFVGVNLASTSQGREVLKDTGKIAGETVKQGSSLITGYANAYSDFKSGDVSQGIKDLKDTTMNNPYAAGALALGVGGVSLYAYSKLNKKDININQGPGTQTLVNSEGTIQDDPFTKLKAKQELEYQDQLNELALKKQRAEIDYQEEINKLNIKTLKSQYEQQSKLSEKGLAETPNAPQYENVVATPLLTSKTQTNVVAPTSTPTKKKTTKKKTTKKKATKKKTTKKKATKKKSLNTSKKKKKK